MMPHCLVQGSFPVGPAIIAIDRHSESARPRRHACHPGCRAGRGRIVARRPVPGGCSARPGIAVDRTSGVEGKSGSGSVDLGGRRMMKKKKDKKINKNAKNT